MPYSGATHTDRHRKGDTMNTTEDTRKAAALDDLSMAATQMVRTLQAAQRDIENALTAAKGGLAVAGTYGPLGPQSSFDIAATKVAVDTAVRIATMLGATQEEVQAAYNAGVAR